MRRSTMTREQADACGIPSRVTGISEGRTWYEIVEPGDTRLNAPGVLGPPAPGSSGSAATGSTNQGDAS